MLKLATNSVSANLLHVLLAIGYVLIIKQLLAIQFSIFGNCCSATGHVLIMLVVVSLGLTMLFLANYALLRHSFLRLGIFASLVVLLYYYVYNPYGHNYVLVYLSIIRSPPHFINMLLVLVTPILVGRFLQSKVQSEVAHA